MRRKKTEERLQIQICTWLKFAYPRVIFTCDLSSGMGMTIGQAVKAQQMRSSKGLPDLFIAEPRGKYNGLFIEFKKEGTKIFKPDGSLYSNEHISNQYLILNQLQQKGYRAVFAVGLTDAMTKINTYLRG